MKLQYIFCVLIMLSLFTSCSEENFDEPLIIEDCQKLEDAKILTEEELKTVCNSEEVYVYQAEYYFVCSCCLCFKLPIPISCDGEAIDVSTLEKRKAFYDEAEYLFNIVEE